MVDEVFVLFHDIDGLAEGFTIITSLVSATVMLIKDD